MIEFIECPQCAAKPGMPTLCPSCLQNRTAISKLNARVQELETALAIVAKTVGLVSERKAGA